MYLSLPYHTEEFRSPTPLCFSYLSYLPSPQLLAVFDIKENYLLIYLVSLGFFWWHTGIFVAGSSSCPVYSVVLEWGLNSPEACGILAP